MLEIKKNLDRFYYTSFKSCICTRVSNGTGQCNFSASNSYQGTGQAGTTCQSPRRDAGWDEILTACPVPQDKTGQSRKVRSKTGKGRAKTEKKTF